MSNIRANIARNIRIFRANSGLNVDEVGTAVGKSGKTISAWEVGRGQPDADALVALCELFNVDISDFYNSNSAASIQAKRLVSLYESLSNDGKTALLIVAEDLVKVFKA